MGPDTSCTIEVVDENDVVHKVILPILEEEISSPPSSSIGMAAAETSHSTDLGSIERPLTENERDAIVMDTWNYAHDGDSFVERSCDTPSIEESAQQGDSSSAFWLAYSDVFGTSDTLFSLHGEEEWDAVTGETTTVPPCLELMSPVSSKRRKVDVSRRPSRFRAERLRPAFLKADV